MLSQYGPLGRTSLDTKPRAGSKACAVKQEGSDLVVELDGYVLCADVKLELYCERAHGLAVLEAADAEPPPSSPLHGGGADAEMAGRGAAAAGGGGKKQRKGSVQIQWLLEKAGAAGGLRGVVASEVRGGEGD